MSEEAKIIQFPSESTGAVVAWIDVNGVRYVPESERDRFALEFARHYYHNRVNQGNIVPAEDVLEQYKASLK